MTRTPTPQERVNRLASIFRCLLVDGIEPTSARSLMRKHETIGTSPLSPPEAARAMLYAEDPEVFAWAAPAAREAA